ncbi:MAG: YfhO family protein [Acetatifactor sp.]|nr:YfhO family protein [Acetatifactor sp.]
MTDESVFSNQNSLFQYLTGLESDLFCSIHTEGEFSEGYSRLSFISDGRPVYCHFNRLYNVAAFYVNGLWHKNMFTDESDCIQYIGCFAEGSKITLELETDVSSEGYEICAFDSELFAHGVEVMRRRSLGITDYSDYGRISGLVNCESDGAIVASIPAANGWSAYVDGKRTPIGITMDTFITVPLTAGDHEVELIYTPPGLICGSAISVIVIVTITVLQYRSIKRVRQEEGRMLS